MVVVGAGPAGMMASAAAARSGARVLLLEKNRRPGRKMAMAGGGRCNFTNSAGPDVMVKNVPGNGQFLYSAFHRFSGEDCRNFFRTLGIESLVESEGKVFPQSGRASDLVAALCGHLCSLGVEIRYDTDVSALLLENGRCMGITTAGGDNFYGRVIVATGGMSYPQTGSTGKGYELAAGAGHRITDLLPSGVALVCRDNWIKWKTVQGLTLKNITITLYDGKQRVGCTGGDLLFTHFGVSGPAVLKVSREASIFFSRCNRVKILAACIDMFPRDSFEQLVNDLEQAGQAEARKTVKNILRSVCPDRIAPVIIDIAGVDGDNRAAGAGKKVWRELARTMKQLPLTVTGTRPLKEAVVTMGGVDVREIEPRTMESKLVKGLFFAGEVLDVDGYTGGFNMQIAFSTGYTAGLSASRK